MSLPRLDAKDVSYAFADDISPRMTIEPGATIVVETRDAYDRQFDESLDIRRYLRERAERATNPVTGPIAVQGARPGDGLAVTILEIRLVTRGYVAASPGVGVLHHAAMVPRVYPFDVRPDGLWFDGRVRLPLRPMIGVIGVAPSRGRIPSLQLGDHGGNMDCNDITVGTTVHLPVNVPGGNLSLGDAHASMGFGEVYSGVNAGADACLHVQLEPGAGWERPWFETDREVMTIGIEDGIEDAIEQAMRGMVQMLQGRLGVSETEAIVLAGAAADMRLGQAAHFGVKVSAYAAFPKSAFVSSGTP